MLKKDHQAWRCVARSRKVRSYQQLKRRGVITWIILVLLLGVALLPSDNTILKAEETSDTASGASSDLQHAPYVKRSSSAIAITESGQTLLVVNPDSGTLSIVDLNEPPTVTEIQVGADPRTVAVSDDNMWAYTANRAGNSVSVVDLAARQVVGNIPTSARPYGVVVSPGGQYLYVAEQGSDQLTIVDTATLARIQTLSLDDRPSGLAITDDGRVLYVTHLLTNSITHLAVPDAGDWSTIQEQEDQIETAVIPLWPDSNLVQSILIAPGGERAYVPHTRANSSNRALTLDSTVFPLVSIIDLTTRQHLIGQQFNLDILDPPAVGLPFDAAFTPDGSGMWVVNAASNDVTVINLHTRERIAHIEVGDNPRGIVISPDGTTAYVNNTLAGSVSVIDTATYTVAADITVTTIPLNPVLLTGKRLFHSSDDPRMGRDQWMSCNTCHFDGEIDGQIWQLGFAGPRNTTSLLGMGDTMPLRWSGEWDEAADSEFAIRMDSFGTGLIEGEMRCSLDPPDCVNHAPHGGVSDNLDALAAYILSLTVAPSPNHMNGQPLSDAARRGETYFNDPVVGCATCHPAPLYMDNLLHDVGTSTDDERIGPAFNTPSLRGIYDTAPYFHDGSAATLYEAITRASNGSEHDVSRTLSEAEIRDLLAFLESLPYES